MGQMLNKIDIWRQAIKESNEACCFISPDDYFLYCNDAWCQLLGYSEYELKEMTWLEITDPKHVGADVGQLKTVKENKNDAYYVEKVYIRKDKTKIKVGIYVHSYPAHGSNEGFIMFCKKLQGSEEYELLKAKFACLEKTVSLLKRISETDREIKTLVKTQGEYIKENRNLIMSVFAKPQVNTNVGDKFSGSFRDVKNTNDSKVMFYLTLGFGFLCTALISIGVVLAYLAYYDTGDAKMSKPEINQPELRM